MTFYLIASQLMHELEQIDPKIRTSVDRIAKALEDPSAMDRNLVKLEQGLLRDIEVRVNKLLTQVMQGPSGDLFTPANADGLKPVQWHALQNRVHQLVGHFRRWRKVQEDVTAQLSSQPQRMYPPKLEPGRIKARQDASSDRVFELLHAVLNPHKQSEAAEEEGAHPDIGLPNSVFHEHMHAAYRVVLAQRLGRPARFLDVGCGAALKLLPAAQYFGEAHGLELDPGYVKAGRHLLRKSGLTQCKVFKANAFDFKRYNSYDVIYFYWPIRDDNLMMALERRIAEKAYPGTLLIAPYSFFEYRFKDMGCARVAGHVYMTQSTAKEAAALRRKAEHMGPQVALEAADKSSPWAPIENTLARNGFRQGVADIGQY